MLSKCLLTCLLFKPFRKTNLQSGALHKTQNTLKAYAVTLALDDMGKLISMMHSKKKCTTLHQAANSMAFYQNTYCKISKEKPQEVTLEKTPPSYLHLQAVIHLEPCTEFSGKTQQLTGVRMGLGC